MDTQIMKIEFVGTAISDGRTVTSDCILQGIKAGANRVYLKNDIHLGWVEVDAETVKQTKFDNGDERINDNTQA